MLDNSYKAEFDEMSPEELINWAWKEFGKAAVFTSSFGAEDMVILDMMSRDGIGIPVATIDTGRLHEETYALMDRASARYGIQIMSFFPDRKEIEKLVGERGMNLFYRSVEERRLCCGIRKLEPLNRILSGKKAWITGLRADQTPNRKNAGVVEIDSQRGVVKVNPLLRMTSDEVWDYIRTNSVPYNRLHDKGFPSIGCEPCTRAVGPGEGERAGRWWWEDDARECGLHVNGSGQDAAKLSFSLDRRIEETEEWKA